MDLGAAALDESRSLVLKHLDALEGIVAELVCKGELTVDDLARLAPRKRPPEQKEVQHDSTVARYAQQRWQAMLFAGDRGCDKHSENAS